MAGTPSPAPSGRAQRQQGAPRQPGTPRQQYDVSRLLAVAVEVFNERGYDGTSMGDLARATGLSKSSIYHHVESKEQLLRLAVDRALGALFAVLDEPGATAKHPVDRLRHVLGREVQVLCAELPYVTLLLRVRGNTPTERSALEERRRFDAKVRAIVEEASASGELRSDFRPALAERLVFGMINSITEWYRPGRASVDELERTVVRLALAGLGAEAPDAPEASARDAS